MKAPDPSHYLWWLASRASGIVALALITVSVGVGLLMAGKLMRRPGMSRILVRVHEHAALAGLIAIGVHGVTLLGDTWLHPGVAGITVPFQMGYRPLYTGLGIVSAYLAAALGLSFYARKWIGARRWRRVHRLTVAVYVLSVVHTLGAGTDAATPWLRTAILVTAAPIVGLFAARMRPRRARARASSPAVRPVSVEDAA